MSATAATLVGVTIPARLAPMSMSKNSRDHWRVQRLAFRHQRDFAIYALAADDVHWRDPLSWPAATLEIEWRYALGRPPDSDNVIARVAGCRDAFQHAGVVRDDSTIRVGKVEFVKVTKGDECVVVSLRREEP